MSQGKFILGALAGLATGALLGIIFAPDKGSTTRKKMAHRGGEYVDNLKGKLGSVLRNGRHHEKTVSESAA